MSDEGRSLSGDLYHLSVQGLLSERWSDWFEGFELTWINQHETLLTGRVVDQAALHGVLGKIRDLGLELLSVTKVECPYDDKMCGRCVATFYAKHAMPPCRQENRDDLRSSHSTQEKEQKCEPRQ
jgi:hypothetical protein